MEKKYKTKEAKSTPFPINGTEEQLKQIIAYIKKIDERLKRVEDLVVINKSDIIQAVKESPKEYISQYQ